MKRHRENLKTMTEEVMMVPISKFERLQDYYKGQISQSALLNKAGCVAAKQHLILTNCKIPDATAIKMVKPLAQEQARLTKRNHLGPAPAATAPKPHADVSPINVIKTINVIPTVNVIKIDHKCNTNHKCNNF